MYWFSEVLLLGFVCVCRIFNDDVVFVYLSCGDICDDKVKFLSSRF